MRYDVYRGTRLEATVAAPTMEAAARQVADTQGLTITHQIGDNHFLTQFGDELRVDPALGWLDLSPALQALATLRQALQALAASNPSQPQREALRDALGALGLVERDLLDAAPPEGEHPGDGGRQRVPELPGDV